MSIAVGLGMFFGTSQLFVNQVAVSAVLVFTVATAGEGFSFARALDALTGGVIALAVAALVLPADPLRLLRDAARPVLDELAATLLDIATALRTRDADEAEAALVRARGIDDFGARFFDATLECARPPGSRPRAGARGTRSSSTPRRRRASTWPCATSACSRAARCGRWRWTRTSRRRSRRRSRTSRGPSARSSARWRAASSFDEVREPALRAASTATHVLAGTTNLSVSVIVGQIRSTATDLLTGIGYTYEEATDAVREASG